ncbi:TPA: transposase [Streptococcus pneumoniae]|nr:transposase [Streptococcus pneumoniae]
MKAPIPKAPLAHSFGSASIIAHTIHQKFNLKVPNYRQEEDWTKMGLPITRKEISNWHIKTSQYYLEPLYNLLRERLLTQPLLHADETSYRVLESDSQLTYYWTFLSGKAEKQGITLYHHVLIDLFILPSCPNRFVHILFQSIINSEKYLSYLLECLPNVETLVNKEVLEAYLPWTKVVQEKCK